MRYGLPWPGTALAADAEAAGVAAFCTGEFAHSDAYVSLTQAVAGSHAAQVGTAIAYAFSRSPYAHATAIRTLADEASDRLFLGLGTGAFRINRDWIGVDATQPAKRMSETVEAIRAFLQAESGDVVRYRGELITIDADIRAPVMGRIDVPILLGAFNKLMVAAAGRVADGVIGHGLFTNAWWNDVVRPALAGGAGDARRVEHGWVITAIDDEMPERAVHDARLMIAFYLTVRTYDPFVTHHGWQSQVATIREAFGRGDLDTMANAVSDEMLTAIAVCGTSTEVEQQLASRAADHSLPTDVAYLSPPGFMVGRRRRASYTTASIELIARLTSR